MLGQPGTIGRHRRNNSGDGLWRRPSSDDDMVRSMRSRRSRSELVSIEADVAALDRRPRKVRLRQRRLRTCAALLVGGVVAACAFLAVTQAHRSRILSPILLKDVASASAFDNCAWRDPKAVAVLTPARAGGRSLVAALGELKLRTERYALRELPVWRPGQSSTVIKRQRKSIKRLVEKAVKSTGRGVLKGAGPRPQDDADVAVIALTRAPREALASAYADLNQDEGPAGPDTVGECALDLRCARAFGLARLCSAQTLALCGGDEACLPDLDGRASQEAVDLALLAINNSVLVTIPSERLDVDGYATLETLLPTYFRGLRSAAPRRPPLQKRERSSGVAARALRQICDPDQQIFDAAALIYTKRALQCEGAAREYAHAVELRNARLAFNRRRERQGVEAATFQPLAARRPPIKPTVMPTVGAVQKLARRAPFAEGLLSGADDEPPPPRARPQPSPPQGT